MSKNKETVQNGKGDRNRSLTKKYADGYDQIDWNKKDPTVTEVVIHNTKKGKVTVFIENEK